MRKADFRPGSKLPSLRRPYEGCYSGNPATTADELSAASCSPAEITAKKHDEDDAFQHSDQRSCFIRIKALLPQQVVGCDVFQARIAEVAVGDNPVNHNGFLEVLRMVHQV